MTSVLTVKREMEKLKQHVMPKHRDALVWNNGDGSYDCGGYKFKDKATLQAYLDDQGYSRAVFIGWQR
jgi:hypothetical protein